MSTEKQRPALLDALIIIAALPVGYNERQQRESNPMHTYATNIGGAQPQPAAPLVVDFSPPIGPLLSGLLKRQASL